MKPMKPPGWVLCFFFRHVRARRFQKLSMHAFVDYGLAINYTNKFTEMRVMQKVCKASAAACGAQTDAPHLKTVAQQRWLTRIKVNSPQASSANCHRVVFYNAAFIRAGSLLDGALCLLSHRISCRISLKKNKNL